MVVQNLPTYLTPFIGRIQEIAQLAASLADPASRLITLVGPGGIGKTRLALEAAHAADLSPFPNGVYFVPLQPVPTSDLLVSAIASAVRFQFYAGSEPREQLLDYLREKHLLLLLDNFEHLLDGVEIISALLSAAPGVRVLVTSRERLKLSGENLFLVDGMRVPAERGEDDPLTYSAVKLFVQSARRVRADFKAEGDDLRYSAEVCRLVGGMPLAILMAAAWVEVLSLKEIEHEIRRGLDLLETELRDIPDRQRSVRVTFDYSWKRLSETERTAFMMLSVFRGGFTREAAQAVTGTNLKTLAGLVNKSLVRVDADGRCDLHELLRQYAQERLKESAQETAAREYHCTYYVRFTAEREAEIYFGPRPESQNEGLDKVEAEKENIVAAFYEAVEQVRPADVRQIFPSLYYYYEIRGAHQEAKTVFTHVVAVMRDRWDSSEEQQRLFGWALGLLGRFVSLQAHYDEAKPILLEGMKRLEPFPPGREKAEILCFLGAEYYAEDYGQSSNWAEEIIAISTLINYPLTLAVGHIAVSGTALWRGEYDLAHQNAARALELSQGANDRYEESWSLWALTNVAISRKDYAAAKHYSKQTILSAQSVHYQRGVLNGHFSMGDIAWEQGEYAEAETYYRTSLAMSNDMGNRFWEAQALSGLGKALREKGEYQASWEHLHQALDHGRQINNQLITLEAMTGVAELFARTGYSVRALELSILILNSAYVFTGNNIVIGLIIRERATRLKDSLRESLDADLFAAAEQRGEALELAATLNDLLDNSEFTPPAAPADAVASQKSTDALNSRELEILQLIAAGLSNRDIASQLFLAESTVKWYNKTIFSKLYVSSRIQAVTRAKELKLIP